MQTVALGMTLTGAEIETSALLGTKRMPVGSHPAWPSCTESTALSVPLNFSWAFRGRCSEVTEDTCKKEIKPAGADFTPF